MKREMKLIVTGLLILTMIGCLTGCEFVNSKAQPIKESITGNEYIADFYTNNGEKFMTMHGERIDLDVNTARTYNYAESAYNTVQSSVVTITREK